MMMRRVRLRFVLLAIAALVGCSESTVIRSDPLGATVYLNEQFIGVSPAAYQVPSALLPERLRYRVEKEGYQTAEGELHSFVSGGRVVGGVFSLGVSLMFKRPRTLEDEYTIILWPAEARAPLRTTDRVEDRLRRLDDLLNRGVISQEEYQRHRQDILGGL